MSINNILNQMKIITNDISRLQNELGEIKTINENKEVKHDQNDLKHFKINQSIPYPRIDIVGKRFSGNRLLTTHLANSYKQVNKWYVWCDEDSELHYRSHLSKCYIFNNTDPSILNLLLKKQNQKINMHSDVLGDDKSKYTIGIVLYNMSRKTLRKVSNLIDQSQHLQIVLIRYDVHAKNVAEWEIPQTDHLFIMNNARGNLFVLGKKYFEYGEKSDKLDEFISLHDKITTGNNTSLVCNKNVQTDELETPFEIYTLLK